jgi:hypothetical protein
MEVSGQLHSPAALTPGKESLVPLDRRLGGTQSRCEGGNEGKNFQPLPGLEPPIIQPVAIPLSYAVHHTTVSGMLRIIYVV